MAGNASDGTIRINAEIDTSGFQKNSQRLESAITSFSQKIIALGKQMEQAIANGATQKQLDGMKSKIANATENMQSLQGKFQALSNTIVSTKQFEDLEKAIGKTQEELTKLYDREEKLKALGADASSIKYEKLQQEIQSTYEQVDTLKEKAKAASEQLKAVMSTSIKGMTATEINERSDRIAQLSNQAAEARAELNAAKTALGELLEEDEKMSASGANLGSKQWQSLQYDIEQAKTRLQDYIEKWQNLVAANQDVYLAGESSNMQKMGAMLQQASESLRQMGTDAETASNALRDDESASRGATSAFTSLANAALKVVSSGISAVFKTLGSVMSKVSSSAIELAKSGFAAVVSGLKTVATNAIKAYVNLYKVVSGGIISGFKKLGSAISSAASSGLKTLGSAALSASKSVFSLHKSNTDLSKGLNVGFKNILRYAFGIRSTFMLVRRLRSAITDGLGSIAKVDSTTNAAISSMITSLNRLKASLSTAFQPIITAISPYVTRLLQLLTQATNKIAEFVAILTGQSYYLKANVTETDYAKSLDTTSKSSDKAAKAAKSNADATKKATNATKKGTKATADANDEMERQLASFDHLNILSDNSKDDSAISGAADAADDLGGAADGLADAAQAVADATSEMGKTTYEKVPVTGFSDFLTKIREAILNQDFDGVGRVIAEKINGMLAKISEWVNWDNIGEKATKVIDSITSVFNGLVDGLDWKLLGETVGNAINSIVYAFDTLLSGIDWINLGKKIGQGLNSLFETVDWSALGGLFATRIGSMLELLYNAIITFDWDKAGADLAEGLNAFILKLEQYFDELDFKKVGESLATGINGFMREFDWKAAGEALGARINDLTFTLAGFVETLKWGDVGSNLATGLNEMIGKIRWSYIGKTLGKGIQGAIDTMTEFVKTFKWGTAGTAFSNAVIALRKEVNIKELGETLGNLVNGAIAYMKNAVRGFTWGNAGGDFADGVNALVGTVNWSDLGKTLANWLNVPFTWLKNAAGKFEWGAAGTSFANAVNALASNVSWSNIGDSFKNLLMGALDMTGKFLQIVQPARLGAGIREALGKIPWDTMANAVWNQAKLAFQNAGSFLDALFGDTGAGMNLSAQQKASLLQNSGYLSDKLVDSRSLGTKIGDKISKALATIPWNDIASTMWRRAQDMISNAGDFVKALLGVTQADVINAGGSEGLAIGKKIGEKVAEGIGKIKWGEFGQFLSDSAINLFNTFTGFFMALGEKDGENKSKLQRAIEEFFGKIDWVELIKSLLEAAVEAFYQLGEALFDAVLDGLTHNADEQVKQNVNEKFEAMNEAVQDNKEDARSVLNAARQYIFSLSGDKNEETFGDSVAMQFYKGLRTGLLDGNGEVKSEYEDILSSILNDQGISMEAFKAGEFDVEQFYSGYLTSAYEEETPTTAKWVELVSRMTGAGSETADAAGKQVADNYVDKGMIPEMEARQDEASEATVNMVDQAALQAELRAEMAGAGIPNALIDGYFDGAKDGQDKVTQATNDMVEGAVAGAKDTAETGGSDVSNKLWSAYIRETLQEQPQTIYAVGDAFDEVWESIDGDGAGSNLAKVYFESFKSKVLDENNKVKPEFVDVVTGMFGSVDGLEAGTVDAKNFMLGLVQGMNDSSGETSGKLVDVINSVLGYVEYSPKGFEQGSPSKRAAKSGKYYMQGIVEGAEGEESSATQKTTSVVSNVLTSVNSTFAGALLLIQKNIPGFTDAVNTLFQNSTSKWNTTFNTGMTNIVNTSATSMTKLQSTILTGLTNLQNHFPTRFATYRSQFSTGWANIKTDTSNAMNQVNSSVRTSMGTLQSTFSSQLSSINSTVSSRMSSIGSTMRSGAQGAMNQVKNVSWFSIGTYIVEGIYNGINSWWGWLNRTVWNLAISLYNTARNALGIHSPSTVFRDGVGKMIGFGVAEGVEDSEPTILDSVADVTDAIMDEMNNADTAVDLGIHADNLLAGLDGVLTTFSDRVGSSFTDLITKLDAIAGSVAFKTPAVAAGGLLPYSVSGNLAGASTGLYGAQQGNDDLASVIIQSTNQAALAIVRAIERASENRSLTKRELTAIVVDEVNRQTRAAGKSPLLL